MNTLRDEESLIFLGIDNQVVGPMYFNKDFSLVEEILVKAKLLLVANLVAWV